MVVQQRTGEVEHLGARGKEHRLQIVGEVGQVPAAAVRDEIAGLPVE
ncbi:hypothetical protein [Streptomyces tauricus]